MKFRFRGLMVLSAAAVFAFAATAAHATTIIYAGGDEIDFDGHGSIGLTSMTFSNSSSDTGTTAGGTARPKATVDGDGTGIFDIYLDQSTGFYHITGVGTPAVFTFSYSSVTSAGFQFLTINSDQGQPDNIQTKVFITQFTDFGSNSSSSSFHNWDSIGYVTMSNLPGDEIPVDISLGAGKKGNGNVPFTVTVVGITPEPGSLALLGTGMLSVAGMAFRRTRKVAV